MMQPWLILGALGAVLVAFGAGYHKGGSDNEAGHVAAALALAEATASRQREIMTAEVDARQFALAQEDQARAEPVQSPACLPACFSRAAAQLIRQALTCRLFQVRRCFPIARWTMPRLRCSGVGIAQTSQCAWRAAKRHGVSCGGGGGAASSLGKIEPLRSSSHA